jgi:hypothetical protein
MQGTHAQYPDIDNKNVFYKISFPSYIYAISLQLLSKKGWILNSAKASHVPSCSVLTSIALPLDWPLHFEDSRQSPPTASPHPERPAQISSNRAQNAARLNLWCYGLCSFRNRSKWSFPHNRVKWKPTYITTTQYLPFSVVTKCRVKYISADISEGCFFL